MQSYLLTKKIAAKAVSIEAYNIYKLMKDGILNRDVICITVVKPWVKYFNGANYEDFVKEAILHEAIVGSSNQDEWVLPFGKISRRKAYFSWKTGLPSRDAMGDGVFMLEEGDVIWPGSVVLGDLVVSGSGVQSEHDEGRAMNIAQTIRSLMINSVRKQKDRGQTFLL